MLLHLLQWPSGSMYLPQDSRMAARLSDSLILLGMITSRSTKGRAATSDGSSPVVALAIFPVLLVCFLPVCQCWCSQHPLAAYIYGILGHRDMLPLFESLLFAIPWTKLTYWWVLVLFKLDQTKSPRGCFNITNAFVRPVLCCQPLSAAMVKQLWCSRPSNRRWG